MRDHFKGIPRMLLCIAFLLNGLLAGSNPKRFNQAYGHILTSIAPPEQTLNYLQWYGHLLFVIGLSILLKFKVSRYLSIIVLALEVVLSIPLIVSGQALYSSMVRHDVIIGGKESDFIGPAAEH